jgi:hypothetical protein
MAVLGQAMLVALVAAALAGCGAKDRVGLEAEPGAQLLVKDDFSDQRSGWPSGPDSAGDVGYESGAYRVHVLGTGDQRSVLRLARGVAVLAVETDVTERAGPRTSESAGLICLAGKHKRAGYEFDVSPAGGFYGIVRLGTNGDTPLGTGDIPGVLKGVGSANRLRALCGKGSRGVRLTLWVDGREVADSTDKNGYGRFTGIALTAGSPRGGTEALFDNLVAVALPAQALRSHGRSTSAQTLPSQGSSASTQTLPPQSSSTSKLCKEDGIRFAGTTARGAKVCFTLTPDRRGLVESGWSFVRASGCPDQAEGTTYSSYPGTIDASGHFENPDGLTGTIRGATASGVFEDTTICPGKTFKWTARRLPRQSVAVAPARPPTRAQLPGIVLPDAVLAHVAPGLRQRYAFFSTGEDAAASTADPNDTGADLKRLGRLAGYVRGRNAPRAFSPRAPRGLLAVGTSVILWTDASAAAASIQRDIEDGKRFSGKHVAGGCW